MRRTRWVLAAALLVAAACSGDDVAPTTSTAAPDTIATTTTEAVTTTTVETTTTSTSTTTTAAPGNDTVGDPEALAALVEEVTEQVRIVYADDSIEVPVPDLTNPDPIVALQEINRFSEIVSASYPFDSWTTITTYPGSPSQQIAIDNAEELMFGSLLRVRPEGPIEYLDIEMVDLATLDLPEETAAGMPPEAVGLLYTSDSGPLLLVDRETGDTVREISPGWSALTVLGILVPTDEGWREWDTILDFGAST